MFLLCVCDLKDSIGSVHAKSTNYPEQIAQDQTKVQNHKITPHDNCKQIIFNPFTRLC